MTNEQATVSARGKLDRLKQDYMSFLLPIALRVHETKSSPTLEEILKCQKLGNKFFNFLETFVGNSGLLGAHSNGIWITGLAEDCYSVLDVYINHINFLRSHKSVPANIIFEPNKLAFSNMQRMVNEYLTEEISNSLKQKYKKNNLPINGFNMPAHEDKKEIPTWQLVVSGIVGLGLVLLITLISVVVPNPTNWQIFVFRGVLSLGLAAIAAVVPGFIYTKARIKGWSNYLNIVAGGAIAIFVLTFFFNPPSLETPNNEKEISKKNE